MKLSVLYFAGLREAVGVSREELELPDEVRTVAAARAWLRLRGETWNTALADGKNIRAALNQRMVTGEALLLDASELAFFPPVTGG